MVTSLSNHDGRIMPSNHVQQNPGLHRTLKPAVTQKNANSIRFEKGIVQVNHALIPGSPILKGKGLEDCYFSVDPKRIVKLQNFGILRERPRRFPEIFGNSRIIFGKSDIRQDENFTPLAQKTLAGINFKNMLRT